MTTIDKFAKTLSEWIESINPESKIAQIAELLKETNPILEDMLWVEGNSPIGHRTIVRPGRTEVKFSMLNKFGYMIVRPGRSEDIKCGTLETYAQVDKSLADLNGNTAAFRLSEDLAFLDDMNQEMAKMVFYGNPASEPDKFMGLAPRYNSADAENVIDCGGTVDDNNTSIWLVTWGALTCHGIFPKDKIPGLWQKNQREVTLTDEDDNPHQGYLTHYMWDVGLVLRDWRYVVRIANIDVDTLKIDASSGANLIRAMIRAIHKIPAGSRGKKVFYCSPTMYTFLDLQTLSHNNTTLRYGPDIHGQEVLKFRGIPVRECDAIVDNEKAI